MPAPSSARSGAAASRPCRTARSEAANALGLRYLSRMRDVILPQAFRIVAAADGRLPGAADQEHVARRDHRLRRATRAGQIISNETFQPFLVFGLVGAIYFVLCWPLSLSARGWSSQVRRRAAERNRVPLHYQHRRKHCMNDHVADTRRRAPALAAGAAALGRRPAAARRSAAAQTTSMRSRARGKVLVGIQGDNPPWGLVNAKRRVGGLRRRYRRGCSPSISASSANSCRSPVANRIPLC